MGHNQVYPQPAFYCVFPAELDMYQVDLNFLHLSVDELSADEKQGRLTTTQFTVSCSYQLQSQQTQLVMNR